MTEFGAKNDLEHNRENDLVKAVKRQLEDVMDPELPFLSISDMGILRDVILEDGHTG